MFPGWVTLHHKANPSIHQSILFHLCISQSGIQQSSIPKSVTAEGKELFSQSKYFRSTKDMLSPHAMIYSNWQYLHSTICKTSHGREKQISQMLNTFLWIFFFTSIMQVRSETLSILLLREGLNKREFRTRLMGKLSDFSFSLFFRDALNLGEFGGPILFCCSKNVEQHGCESSSQMTVH